MRPRRSPSDAGRDAVRLLPATQPSGRIRIGRTVEAGSTWCRTIAAPIGSVWEEVATLEAILSPVAGLVADAGLGGRSASLAVQFRWGPMAWVAHGAVAIHQVSAPRHLLVVANLDELSLTYRGEVDLVSTGADRTTLGLRGRVRCGHWLARRCPAMLEGIVEDHARAVAARVRRRAEGRHQAGVRLSDPGRAGPATGRG